MAKGTLRKFKRKQHWKDRRESSENNHSCGTPHVFYPTSISLSKVKASGEFEYTTNYSPLLATPFLYTGKSVITIG